MQPNRFVVAALAAVALSACQDSLTTFPVADAGQPCGSGTTACGGQCVTLAVDDKNCGACGVACKSTEACANSQCYPVTCLGTQCGAGQVCVGSTTCKEKACVGVTCPTGQTCSAGVCQPETCNGTPCSPGKVCLNNTCTDPQCQGVACAQDNTCVGGKCFPNTCADATCAAGQVCVNGVACTDINCVPVSCPSGQTCVAGACQPEACGATACPVGQTCQGGACKDMACVGVTCPSGKVCQQGMCVTGSSCDGGVAEDPNNCGSCGNVCPKPVHAAAACQAGTCGRGACEPGFYDLDGPATPGCESTCTGTTCTLPDGGTVTVTVPPAAEAGASAGLFSAGASLGGTAQANGQYRHLGILGEAPGTAGTPSANGTYKNVGGFTGIAK